MLRFKRPAQRMCLDEVSESFFNLSEKNDQRFVFEQHIQAPILSSGIIQQADSRILRLLQANPRC